MSDHPPPPPGSKSDFNPETPNGMPTPASQREGVTIGSAGSFSPNDSFFFFLIDEPAREYDVTLRYFLRKVRRDQARARQPPCDFVFVNAIVFDPQRRVLLVRPRTGNGCPVELDTRWSLPGTWCHRSDKRLLSVLAEALYEHLDLETTRVCSRYLTETRLYQQPGRPGMTQTLVLSFIVEVVDHIVDLTSQKYARYAWAAEHQVRAQKVGGANLRLVSNTVHHLLPLAFPRLDASNGTSSPQDPS